MHTQSWAHDGVRDAASRAAAGGVSVLVLYDVASTFRGDDVAVGTGLDSLLHQLVPERTLLNAVLEDGCGGAGRKPVQARRDRNRGLVAVVHDRAASILDPLPDSHAVGEAALAKIDLQLDQVIATT